MLASKLMGFDGAYLSMLWTRTSGADQAASHTSNWYHRVAVSCCMSENGLQMAYGFERLPGTALMVVCTASVRQLRRRECCDVVGEDDMYIGRYYSEDCYLLGIMKDVAE